VRVRERESHGDRVGASGQSFALQSESHVTGVAVSEGRSRPRRRPPLPLVHRYQHQRVDLTRTRRNLPDPLFLSLYID
jgi:hypothetical protein